MELSGEDFSPICGGMCFYQGHDSPDNHLWFIISAPEDTRECDVICCNFTTYNYHGNSMDAYNDATTIVEAWEHPRLKHVSCVCYEGFSPPDTYHDFIARLNEGGDQGFCRCDPPLSPELLVRIRKGAETSPFLTPYAADILQKQGII